MPSNPTERRALRLSPVGYLVFGLLGIGFFLSTGSEAILLDGVYSLISLALALLALRVSKLVTLPGSKRFHFGYAHFEPLINTVRVALILGVDAFALASAIHALTTGGRAFDTGLGVIYGILSATACITMSVLQRRAARTTESPILRVDARNWFVDGLISSGVGLTFLLGVFLERSPNAHWVPFLDPILVIGLILISLPITFKSLRENVPQVLFAAPKQNLQDQVRAQVDHALADFDHRDQSIRMLQIGRIFYVQIHVLTPENTTTIDIQHCDRIRRDLDTTLAQLHPRPVIDVIFTADPRDLLVLDKESSPGNSF